MSEPKFSELLRDMVEALRGIVHPDVHLGIHLQVNAFERLAQFYESREKSDAAPQMDMEIQTIVKVLERALRYVAEIQSDTGDKEDGDKILAAAAALGVLPATKNVPWP